MRIDGSTVLITGASSGIGAATARAVAGKGGHPVLLARRQELLDELVAQIGGSARAYAVDCADHEAVADVAARVTNELGTPDSIVNNAGAGRFLFLEETRPAEFEQMMGAPLLAAAHVTRAFLPGMLARNRGCIVNVNAPVAFIAWPGSTGYATARWALRGFNEALRVDLHGTAVKVIHVVPGKVASTYFEANPGADEGIPGIARMIRTLTPEEVAEMITVGLEREPKQVIGPRMLRVLLALSRVFPGVTERLLIKTGKRRPPIAAASPAEGKSGVDH